MDTVQDEVQSFTRRVGAADREKLDEYFLLGARTRAAAGDSPRPGRTSPSPSSTCKPPRDITNGTDLIGRMRLLFDLIPLALQTDSTRLMTILLARRPTAFRRSPA